MRIPTLIVVLLAGAEAIRVDEGLNPIRRVVTLLQNMQKEIAAEGEKEKELYDKFMCYCEGGAGKMGKESEAAIQEAAAQAAKGKEAEAQKEQTDAELAEHKNDRAEAKIAIKKATSMRNKEHASFEEQFGDLKTNLAALDKAVDALSKGMGGAFLQASAQQALRVKRIAESSQAISSYEREDVLSFLSGKSPFGDYAAASGQIVGVLKEMRDEMDRDANGAASAEEDAQKSFDELIGAKQKEIAAATKSIEAKTTRAGQLAVAAVEAKQASKEAAASASESAQMMANLKESCDQKTAEWDERTKTRNDELLAIADAIKVLNDDDALELFKKNLGPSAPMAFLQMNRRPIALRREAFGIVDGAANKDVRMRKIALALAQAGKVDFSKVIKMIDAMVVTLGKEQKDDDEELQFCNMRLNEENDLKKETEKDLDRTQKNIDELDGQIADLGAKIEQLTNDIKNLDEMTADATDNRKQENEEYNQFMLENNSVKMILGKVINRLNKFYNPQLYVEPPTRELTEEERIAQNMGEALPTEQPQFIPGTTIPVFLQMGDEPATWDNSLKKNKKSGGVLALMDMLVKDVETAIQEAEHDEKQAQKEYEALMSDAKKERQQSATEITNSEESKASAEVALSEAKDTRTSKLGTLEATNKAIVELHGNCDFLINNYDMRKAARETEVSSLKDAKAVLSGADFSFMQTDAVIKEDPPKEESKDAAEEMTKDLEVNFNKIQPFGKEDTAHELQNHAATTQNTLVDAVENAEVAEIKRAVFRALTRLRAATIKEFDTIARLETQAIDAYNDAHHYRAENPLTHLHDDEAPVPTDKLKSFH